MCFDIMNLGFYLSSWLCLLLLVCIDIESNPDPGDPGPGLFV